MLTVLSSAPSRKALLSAVPLSDAAKKTKLDNDKTIKDIVGGKDNRKLVVCGPCSADNPEAAVEYCVRLKSVADKVQIDRTYLYRLFKEETGFSVIEYINNCRIGRACTMLNNTNVQIKDVALSVGFSDQLYFSKVFRKLKGITPTEYRKKHANETTL